MSDRRSIDEQLRQELQHLGEPDASAEEIAAAEHLATRLEGALHRVDSTDDSGLAELARSIRIAAGADKDTGADLSQKMVAEMFAGDDALAPANDIETRRADSLARGVDLLIAGCQTQPLPGSVQELIEVAAMIRAGAHTASLSKARLDSILDQALGTAQPAVSSIPRRWRLLAGAGIAVAAVLAMLIVGALLWRPPSTPTGRPPIPTHLTSRSTRDILPGAFPRTQTSTDRIDLIYQDRLRSYRAVSLGALGSDTGTGSGGIR